MAKKIRFRHRRNAYSSAIGRRNAHKAPAGELSIYNLMGILFSALLGFFILHQIPTVRTFIGGGLVVLASLLLFFYKKRWLKTNDSSVG